MNKKVMVMLLTLVVAVFTVSGCGSQQTSQQKQEDLSFIIADEADFFGGFNVLSSEVHTGMFRYTGNIYETLILYDKEGMKPGLAQSWEVEDNTITFKLREGVMFTDGAVFNAEAVKLHFDTLKTLMGEEMSWFSGVSKLQQVNVIEDYVVEFVYDTPYIAALQDLSVSYPMAIMSPNVYEDGGVSEDINRQTMGTGPYKIEAFEKGEYYTFVRNEDYWGEKPQVQQFTIKIVPDMEARMLALKVGEVDMVYGHMNISQDALVEFKDDKNFTVKIADDIFSTRNILLNSTKAPFDDLQVRQAVQYAIDKETISDKLLYGLEDKADYLLQPQLPYCDVSLEPYVYNMDKAKELLKASGWSDTDNDGILDKQGQPLEVEILFRTSYGIEEDIGQAVASQLKKVGFRVKNVGLETMAWYGKALEGDFQATMNDTYGVPYDPHTFLSPMLNYSADNPAQQGLSQKEQIDESIREIFNTVDPETIQENYAYILQTLHQEALNLSISYTKDSVIFNQDKIGDYTFGNQTREFYVSGVKMK